MLLLEAKRPGDTPPHGETLSEPGSFVTRLEDVGRPGLVPVHQALFHHPRVNGDEFLEHGTLPSMNRSDLMDQIYQSSTSM